MLVDHMGVAFFPGFTEMRVIGRMALPLYAWCLVVGCVKTSDPVKYGLRLLALAVISQPLNMMALSNPWSKLNILFLLALGLFAIQGIRMKRCLSQLWVPLLCYAALGYLNVDYGWKGLTFIILLYFARGSRGGLIAAYLAYAMFWGANSSAVNSLFGVRLQFLEWNGVGPLLASFFRMQGMIWLSLPLIALRTRSGIAMPKRLGYALYPLHLLALIIARLCMGETVAAVLSCFY